MLSCTVAQSAMKKQVYSLESNQPYRKLVWPAFGSFQISRQTLIYRKNVGLAPTIHERAKITSDMSKIASLLATEELYNIVAKDERSNPRRKGFVSWVHALTASQARREVERKVRQAMEDTNSPYDQQIRSEIPRKFQSLLPALASQVAHESTEAAFEKLKTQMVQAGQWDKGYLESGNNLVGNPIHFEQLKGNKAGLKAACRNECVGHAACRGYTYHPTQAVCYLKTVTSPVRGVDCESDCWYWGRVVGHPHEMSLSLADAEKDLGLHVTDLKVGSGEVLAPGDTATIGYVGTLENGVVFDQVLAPPCRPGARIFLTNWLGRASMFLHLVEGRCEIYSFH
jgi:hypothetical protein